MTETNKSMESKVDKAILTGDEWDKIVLTQIKTMTENYTNNSQMQKILARWQESVTLGYKHNENFSPHVNGFYMIFMVHGTWYDKMKEGVPDINNGEDYENGFAKESSQNGISDKITGKVTLDFTNPNSHLNMLATDIDIPDITEEYVSVSSRIRNSFVPSRDYFVSDFNISYIENINLDIMRYHEAWHKYLNLIKRGEIAVNEFSCDDNEEGYFLDMPYSNATWVVIFRPFTTEIQALIKLIGVMPVTMPLKQIIGNRSQSKMTVLNISYKAADIFYKFYKGTDEMLKDNGLLVNSFKREVLKI